MKHLNYKQFISAWQGFKFEQPMLTHTVPPEVPERVLLPASQNIDLAPMRAAGMLIAVTWSLTALGELAPEARTPSTHMLLAYVCCHLGLLYDKGKKQKVIRLKRSVWWTYSSLQKWCGYAFLTASASPSGWTWEPEMIRNYNAAYHTIRLSSLNKHQQANKLPYSPKSPLVTVGCLNRWAMHLFFEYSHPLHQ